MSDCCMCFVVYSGEVSTLVFPYLDVRLLYVFFSLWWCGEDFSVSLFSCQTVVCVLLSIVVR